MNKSENINELAAALAKAQLEMQPAKKDATNPFFKSGYATLGSISEACLHSLNTNGISVTQTTEAGAAIVVLVTTLMHSSGQWISSTYPVHPTKNDPQSLGSAISYARRYSLAAITGVVTTDDDAEMAMNRSDAAEKPVQKPKDPINDSNWVSGPTDKQIARLMAIAHECHWSDEDIKNYLGQMGLKSRKQLNKQQYNALCESMAKFPKEASH